MDSIDLRLIYFIGGLVAVLILLLVSFILNARRASRLENTLDELQAQLTRANAQLDDTAKSLDDLYGRRKRGELNLPNSEEQTLATEIKKADGTSTTLGDAISELYYKLGESADEQEKAYANIISEQQGLKDSLGEIKQMLSSGGKPARPSSRPAAQPEASQYAEGVAYLDEDAPAALSAEDITTGLSSLTRSLAAAGSAPVPLSAAPGRDPMNPLGMGAPEGAAAARSFPRPDGTQSAGTDAAGADSAAANPSSAQRASSGTAEPGSGSAQASGTADHSDSTRDPVSAVSQSSALNGAALAPDADALAGADADAGAGADDTGADVGADAMVGVEADSALADELLADRVLADVEVAAALDEVADTERAAELAEELSDDDLAPLGAEDSVAAVMPHAYDLGVEFTNPLSEAALASSFDAPAEAKLADGADFTSDLDLGALSADVPSSEDSGIYMPEGSAELSALDSALDVELSPEFQAQEPSEEEFDKATDELRFDALSSLTTRIARKNAERTPPADAQAAASTLTIDFEPSNAIDGGSDLKITVSGSAIKPDASDLAVAAPVHGASGKSAPGKSAPGKSAPVVDMIYDPDYVRKYQAEKPFGINVETLNKAHEFIVAGISLSELSAKTGLSEEELRLLYDVDAEGHIKESADFAANSGLSVAGAAGLSDEELSGHSQQAQASFAEPEVKLWRQSLGEPSGDSLDAVQAQDAAGSLALNDQGAGPRASSPRAAERTPQSALDQAERATIATMMQDQPDPFAPVAAAPAAEPEAPAAAVSDDELDEKEALVQKLAQNKEQRRKRRQAQATREQTTKPAAAEQIGPAPEPSAPRSVALSADAAEDEDEHTALERKLKAGRRAQPEVPAERAAVPAAPEAASAAAPEEPTEVERLAQSIISGSRAKAARAQEQAAAAPSTGDVELDALSAALIAETERAAATQPELGGAVNVAAVAQAIVSALSAEEKEQLKNNAEYQQDLARDIAAALAAETQDDQVDLRSIQAQAVASSAQPQTEVTPSGAPRAPMMPFRRRSAKQALNPAPIGAVEAVGSYGAEGMGAVSGVPEGFGAVPTMGAPLGAPMAGTMGGPAVRPGAGASQGAAPSAASLLARGPQSSGRGLNAMLSPNPTMAGLAQADAMGQGDALGAPVDSKLSQALAQMGELASGRGATGVKAKDLARASANPGLNFSAGTAMNPGMADMLGAPMGMGTIDGPYGGYGAGSYEDDDPSAVLNEVVNNGLNSVAPLTQEQLDTLNQLQSGLAAPAPEPPRSQHYASYQARNAYGIRR
ncbi:MAG TPA: hypothetical protein H9898_09725 [Candidatus Anaerobiospirillum stercoravium]|nr:hypothetical protein [Candidatus Anaerobiospirillum stercoravium]